jgi:putative ABC transport system permease protein
MSVFVQDLKHSVRSFARTPGFTLLAVLTLALGIGANTAIFSVVNGVILKPLGYPEPDRLIMITSQFPGLGFDQFWMDPPEYIDFKTNNKSFESVGAYTIGAVNIGAGDRPARVTSAGVTASLFDALRVPAFRGRGFEPDDNMPNTARVAVLSHELWHRQFAGDESIIGRTIEIQGVNRTIVGIMPPGFDIHDARVEIWIPLSLDPAAPGFRGNHFLYLVGRLRDGVSVTQARAELQTLLRGWRELAGGGQIHVPNDSTHRVQYEPLQDDVVGSARTALWVLQGAVGFVLLIACANLANLLLARAEARHKEFAIRSALGAGRGRLLRQFATEGVVLSVAGAAVGTFLAWAGLRALLGANPDSIPRSTEIGLDGAVLVFTLGIAVLTGIIFGLAPLLHLSQGSTSLALKEGGTRTTAGLTRATVRRGLVVVEVALAVMLVIGAGLLLRSFWNVMSVDSGFDRNNLVTFNVVIPGPRYPENPRRVAFFQQLNERLSAIPGVTAVAAMSGLPPSRQVNANDTDFEGVTFQPGGPAPNVDYYQNTTIDYVRTMGIPIVEGRAFGPGDVGSAPPVMLVNEALARRFYPNQSVVGRRIRPAGVPDSIWFTVVGVLEDVKQGGLDEPTGTELYLAHEQSATWLGFTPVNMHIVIRSTLPLGTLAPSIRQAVAAMDPALPIVNLRTMEEVFSQSVASPRFIAQLLGIFASLALVLAAIGTYGILSYSVTERRHEIGIRMALGADRGSVLAMIVAQGMKVTMIGLVAGVIGALLLTRLVETMLFDVRPTDPVTFVAVALVVTLVAVVACVIPARRATRVDPMVVLRDE